MAYSYIIWLLVFVCIPLVILWGVWGRELWKYRRVMLLAPIGSLVFSIPWDIISVQERIWYFETPYILGVWFGGLPLEEYLFIILVTLVFASASVLVWKRYQERV